MAADNVNGLVPVLVTTAHRGVFFGFAAEDGLDSKEKIVLKKARNCLYWSAMVGGFLGLAKTGPNSECRIGAEAPSVILHDITSVAMCTEEAVSAWTR